MERIRQRHWRKEVNSRNINGKQLWIGTPACFLSPLLATLRGDRRIIGGESNNSHHACRPPRVHKELLGKLWKCRALE
jgi:hypothetical protein